jgi:Secretion system C-terminal sorting domain
MITKYFIAGVALLTTLQADAQQKTNVLERFLPKTKQATRSVNTFLPTTEKQFIWNPEFSIWDSVSIRNYVYFESNLDTVNIGDPVTNELNSREIYTRTPLEDAVVTQFFINDSWENMQKTITTRDNQGYQTGNQYFIWENGDWTLQFGDRILTNYDGSGRLISAESQGWDSAEQTWLTYSGTTAIYNGDLLEQLNFQEASADGTLEDILYATFGYQNGSTEADTATIFMSMGGEFLPVSRLLVSRWANFGDLVNLEPVSFTEQEYLDGNFVDVFRQVRSDLDNGGYQDLGEDFDGDDWTLSYQFNLLIDDKGNIIEEKSEYYSDGELFIEYANLFTYTYDPNDNILERVQQFYDINTNEYQFNNRSVFGVYLDVTGIESASNESLALYPNPTDAFLNLPSTTRIEEVRIFDAQGRIVKQEVSNTNQINVSDLEAGLYILQANMNNRLVSTRFIKQ